MSGKQKIKRRSDGTFDKGTRAGRRFKPGKSGNPKGRPKDWKQYAREAILKIEGLEPDSDEYLRAVAELTWKYAKNGNYQALRDINDRLWGRVPEVKEIYEHRRQEILISVSNLLVQAVILETNDKYLATRIFDRVRQLRSG